MNKRHKHAEAIKVYKDAAMNTMGSGMSAFEYKSDVEPHWMHKNANGSVGCVGHDCDECKTVPSKTEIIKTLHQELMVKELRIKELEAAIGAVEIDADEVLDFDECTAMLIPLDTYHRLVETAEKLKGGA